MKPIPALAKIPRKQPNGRTRRTSEPTDEAVMALKMRCIREGRSVTNANIREMRSPHWGCYAGRVIANEIMADVERADLWTAIVDMRRRVVAYDRAKGAPKRHAACLRLLAPVDEFSADTETPPLDTRTDEERSRQAESAWMQLLGWLNTVDWAAQVVTRDCVLDDKSCPDREGLLLGLRAVSDGLKGKRMVNRRRK